MLVLRRGTEGLGGGAGYSGGGVSWRWGVLVRCVLFIIWSSFWEMLSSIRRCGFRGCLIMYVIEQPAVVSAISARIPVAAEKISVL